MEKKKTITQVGRDGEREREREKEKERDRNRERETERERESMTRMCCAMGVVLRAGSERFKLKMVPSEINNASNKKQVKVYDRETVLNYLGKEKKDDKGHLSDRQRRTTIRQTDRQTGRRTNRQIDGQTCR